MKKKLILAFPLVIILAFAVWLKSSFALKPRQTNTVSPTSSQTQKQNVAKVRLVYSENDKKEFNYNFTDKKTAFDALKEVSDREEIALETKQYDFGIFVKSINGLE